MYQSRKPLLSALALTIISLLIVTGISAYDRMTWVMEVFPIFVALPLLFATYARHPLTTMLYCLIALHACILMLGGMYTYARVPLGFEIAQLFELTRNPYDKIGHFFQGFVPALVAREILIRGVYIRGRKMLVFVILSIVMGISATYELIEWLAALLLNQGADAFLGTQGDPWDTQSDMFSALIGGITSLLFFTKLHDKQLSKQA
jgi:putative membrane protein